MIDSNPGAARPLGQVQRALSFSFFFQVPFSAWDRLGRAQERAEFLRRRILDEVGAAASDGRLTVHRGGHKGGPVITEGWGKPHTPTLLAAPGSP